MEKKDDIKYNILYYNEQCLIVGIRSGFGDLTICPPKNEPVKHFNITIKKEGVELKLPFCESLDDIKFACGKMGIGYKFID